MNDETTIIEGDDDMTDETSGMDDTETNDADEVVHDGEIVSAEEAEHALTTNGNGSGAVENFYASLGSEVATEVRGAAEDARSKMFDMRDNAVEAGRILNRVRNLLGHGQFGKWLKLEFGQTDRTARNLMSLANSADTAFQIAGHDAESKILALPPTVAYDLGANNLPDPDRNEIIEAIDRGDLKDPKEVRKVINERKAAANEKRGAEKAASGKGGKDGSGEGDGEGDGETFAERKKKHSEALRRSSAFSLAVSLVAGDEEGDEGKTDAADVVSLYGEIGSGPKGKMTAEDHAATSEMIYKVAQAYAKGGMDAVNKLKPVVPDAPVAKGKKAKKTDEGDD